MQRHAAELRIPVLQKIVLSAQEAEAERARTFVQQNLNAMAVKLGEMQAQLVRSLLAEIDDLADIRDELDRTILDEPPAFARDGGMIRDGVDPEFDDLRWISRSGKQRIA